MAGAVSLEWVSSCCLWKRVHCCLSACRYSKTVFTAPLMASWLCSSCTSLPLEHTQRECNRLSCFTARIESHIAACCSNRQHAPSYMRQQAQRRLSARHSVQLRVLCQAGKTGGAAHGESEAEIPQSREEAVTSPAARLPAAYHLMRAIPSESLGAFADSAGV